VADCDEGERRRGGQAASASASTADVDDVCVRVKHADMRTPRILLLIGAISASPALACGPNLRAPLTPEKLANEAKRAVAGADAIVDVVVVGVSADGHRRPEAILKVINRFKGPPVDRFVVSEPIGACTLSIRAQGRFGRVLLKRYTGRDGRSSWFAPSDLNTGGEPSSDTFDRAVDTILEDRRSRRFEGNLWD
jgi:hypothetical protein